MQSLVLIAIGLGAAPVVPERTARALPCAARYAPMALRIAAAPVPLPRPQRAIVPRRLPCHRLASA